jgi:hypothetical protein
MRPVAATLTDGSGHGAKPRLELSRSLLLACGATPSQLYGVATDRDLYRIILECRHSFFLELSDALAAMLMKHRIECVVGDAMEGYNPTHDICRLLIDRAVRIASAETGKAVGNLAFPLVGHPSPAESAPGSLRITLSAEELLLKLSEARRYGEKVGGILVSEMEESLVRYGENAFGQEAFFPANTGVVLAGMERQKPFYEIYGEKQVEAGFYNTVIRYRDHIAPLAAALSA